MSRWHQSTCVEPDVHIDEKILQCRACSSQCMWQELVPSTEYASIPPTPRNESPWELNLWWPPSVPYAKLEFSVDTEESDLEDPLVGEAPTVSDPFPIYGNVLGPDEFRLICLSATSVEERSHTSPLHISLETHSDNRCPDYEAVSYTWGGEDGDYARSRPIFIGQFWDILFQTRNCWEMLQFIQPYKGVRTVWVDAICINQSDLEERSQQVAKMSQLYQQCFRVIIYLGPHMSTHDPLPLRHELYELEEDIVHPEVTESLQTQRPSMFYLLKQKYFTRLWVVQELILAPSAIVRLGNEEYRIGSREMTDLRTSISSQQWDSYGAPWFQHATRGNFLADDFYELVRLTSKSRASDPRDRVFGVLGLMKSNELKPDYTLSAAHVFTGFFAYCILILRQSHLFLKSKGSAALEDSLTWMPDWESEEAWRNTFTPENQETEEMDTMLIEYIQSHPAPLEEGSEVESSQFDELYEISTSDADTESLKETLQSPSQNFSNNRPWFQDGAIRTHTGALSIFLIRFCSIPSRPTFVQKCRDWNIFEIRGLKGAVYLSSRSNLAAVCHPREDDIYILNSANSSPLMFLILRKHYLSNTFQLVASCQRLLLGLQKSSGYRPKLTETPIIQSLGIVDIRPTVYYLLDRLRTLLKWSDVEHIHNQLIDHELIPTGKRFSLENVLLGESDGFGNFSLYRAILEGDPGNSARFVKSCLPGKYDVDAGSGNSDGHGSGSVRDHFCRIAEISWDYPNSDELEGFQLYEVSSHIRDVPILKWQVLPGSFRGCAIFVRTDYLRDWFMAFTKPEIEIMQVLIRWLNVDLDDLEILVKGDPELESIFGDFGCLLKLDTIEGDFGIDGHIRQVDIL